MFEALDTGKAEACNMTPVWLIRPMRRREKSKSGNSCWAEPNEQINVPLNFIFFFLLLIYSMQMG